MPQNSDTLVVVFGTNERYAMPLAVTLASIFEHVTGPVEVYIISTGLSEHTKARLTRAANSGSRSPRVSFVPVGAELLGSFPLFGHISSDALLRLFIADLLPQSIEKALYLDCDLYVFEDIRKLWSMDLSRYAVLAARDLATPRVSSKLGLPNYKDLGLSPDTPYFNTGVLLMNLRLWREEGIGPRALEYVKNHLQIVKFADQDALNALLPNRWGHLELRWNAVLNELRYVDRWEDGEFKRKVEAERIELMRHPAICHYASVFKPWNPGHQIPRIPAWMSGLWRSGWFGPLQLTSWYGSWLLRHFWHLFERKVFGRPDPLVQS
jgi:lipopolysaccharide biosynthesis glycosyltransferase